MSPRLVVFRGKFGYGLKVVKGDSFASSFRHFLDCQVRFLLFRIDRSKFPIHVWLFHQMRLGRFTVFQARFDSSGQYWPRELWRVTGIHLFWLPFNGHWIWFGCWATSLSHLVVLAFKIFLLIIIEKSCPRLNSSSRAACIN